MPTVDDYAPDATIRTVGTLTGGATLHAVLNDANSATYTTTYAGEGDGKVSFATPTKPAGSVLKQMRLTVGLSSVSVNTTRIDAWIEYPAGVASSSSLAAQYAGTTEQYLETPWVQPGDLSAATIGADVWGCFRRSVSGAITNLRVSGMQLDLVWAYQPTTTVTFPTGGVSTSTSVLAEWSHTPGQDGGGQRWYRVVVTIPATLQTFLDTGTVSSGASSHLISGLAPGTTYNVTVYTAQEVYAGSPHWSAGDSDTITITPASTAEVDTLTTIPDSMNGAIILTATRDTAEDAWDRVQPERLYGDNLLGTDGEFESGSGGIGDGWEFEEIGGISGESSSLETTGAESGQFQRFAATTAGAGNFYMLRHDTFYPCDPGDHVEAWARVRGGGTFRMSILFSTKSPGDATGVLWEDSDAISSAGFEQVLGASWATLRVQGSTAPAGTRSVRLAPHLGSSVAGGPGNVDIDRIYLVRSKVGWENVRGGYFVTPGADLQDYADFEAPPDTEVYYRARAVVDAGPVAGQWVYADPIEWSVVDGLWLKSPHNPNVNLNICPAGWLADEYPRQFAVYAPRDATRHRSVSSVLMGPTGTLEFETATKAESDAVKAVLTEPVVLVHFAEAYDIEWFYAQIGNVSVQRDGAPGSHVRYWSVPYWSVPSP